MAVKRRVDRYKKSIIIKLTLVEVVHVFCLNHFVILEFKWINKSYKGGKITGVLQKKKIWKNVHFQFCFE